MPAGKKVEMKSRSRLEVFCKKGTLKNLSKSLSKTTMQEHLFIKARKPATLFKRNSGTGVFLCMLRTAIL